MSFTASLCLLVIVIVPLIVFAHYRLTGIQPKESWLEIVIAFTLLVLLVYLLQRHRAEHIKRILDSGTLVTARVERSLAINMWVFVRLVYQWEGRGITRDIMYARSKRTTRLTKKEQVTLAVDPHRAGQVIIVDVYSPDP
jgi:hypothetical protein